MSEQERPEWLSKPEWKGWSYDYRSMSVGRSMIFGAGVGFEVRDDRELRIACDDRLVILPMPPEAALRVANAIAKELGGWPGEEA